jgi:ubiquinone/menaquinone biosynthesis C-methylase UbiE
VVAGALHRRFGEVVALDLPDAGLRADWRSCPGPRFLHADAQALPFGDGRFEVVVAAEVLEHLPDPVRGLDEMARVGRRRGGSQPDTAARNRDAAGRSGVLSST